MKNSYIYIQHVIEAINKIERYVYKLDEASFYKDDLVQDAVLRQIQVIGEATKRIEEEIRNANPQILWQKIIAMRNILVHDYFDVDLAVVWTTLAEDLPQLKKEFLKLIKN